MTKVWDFTFQELHVSTEEHPVLAAERPFNPRGNRETFAQVMFESYKTPGFYLAFDPVLALYACGRILGTMVDVGEGVTHVVPVTEAVTPKEATKRVDVAGRDVTSQLQSLLQEKGFSFTTSAEIDEVRDLKERCCFVSENVGKSLLNGKTIEALRHFKLPDGKSVDLGDECYQCSEIIFQRDGAHIGELITDSIRSCDIVNRKDLYREIILSGGTTLLPGFKRRLEMELLSILPAAAASSTAASSTAVKIRKYPDCKYHVWLGGSILGSLASFSQMWIRKSEYNEYGPSIVHRKCIK